MARTTPIQCHLAFFGQPAKCEVAHTSLRLFPTKIRQPGNQEGTHGTKTSHRRRDCSCNGVDHPNGHGIGHAELVTDFRSSTSTFVLRRSIIAADPGPPPGGRAVLRHSFVIGFDKQMFGADGQVRRRWAERLTKRSTLHRAYTIRQSGTPLRWWQRRTNDWRKITKPGRL